MVGYGGELRFDRSRPDGMPFKGLDSSRLHEMGWRPGWTLRRGLERTYEWFVDDARPDAGSKSRAGP